MYLVVTTINSPTQAVSNFSLLDNVNLVVVADQKTPRDWHLDDADFLSVARQKDLFPKISHLIPYNHYSRKNIGYLYAAREGAQSIADTDDDNSPKENWDFPSFEGFFEITPQNLGFVNVYKYFSPMHIWPRGFPLELINNKSSILEESNFNSQVSKIGVWQGLADGDPDVDAIYRLTSNKPCYFQERFPIVLSRGTICPFNSQNTAFRKEVYPLLYLPSFVNFRFTDILRGLVAQPILWLYNFHVGFTSATVIQERNPHDYMKDFIDEIPCYKFPVQVIEVVSSSISSSVSIEENLYNGYKALVGEKIVDEKEMPIIEAWLAELSN